MEYLVGFITTLTVVMIFSWYIVKSRVSNKINFSMPIRYSQSHVHNLVSPLLPPSVSYRKNIISQSTKHENSTSIKVIMMDDAAYWIKDNTFYCAQIDENGTVDKETTAVVDTMSMDRVQLDKMLFIMDKLREGLYDDSGGSGNQ